MNLKDLDESQLLALGMSLNNVMRELTSLRIAFGLTWDNLDVKKELGEFSVFYNSAFDMAKIVKMELELKTDSD